MMVMMQQITPTFVQQPIFASVQLVFSSTKNTQQQQKPKVRSQQFSWKGTSSAFPASVGLSISESHSLLCPGAPGNACGKNRGFTIYFSTSSIYKVSICQHMIDAMEVGPGVRKLSEHQQLCSEAIH